MTRRIYRRPINKYRLTHIDGEGLHAFGPRGAHMIFMRLKLHTYRVWYCCQCQGRVNYGDKLWRPRAHSIYDRICDSCAAEVPGYRREGQSAAERNRPAEYALENYPLIAHAYRELDIAHLFDDEADIGACVLKMIETFARADLRATGAVDLVLKTFWDLAHRRPITGLTNHPIEWQDISAQAGRPLWRNVRDNEAYSEDGGKTFYRLEHPEKRLKALTTYERH